MQQYKNDMDKITVSDELKSKILAAADKKIKNSKIITFKKAAAAAAGLAVCISVSGLMHGFITSRNKPQQELKPSVSKTEQPKTEKGDNIPDDTIIGNPVPEDSNIPQPGKDAESSAPRGEKPHADNNAAAPEQPNEIVQPPTLTEHPDSSESSAPPQSQAPDIPSDGDEEPGPAMSAPPQSSDYAFDDDGIGKLRAELGYDFSVPHYIPDGYAAESADLLFGSLVQLTYTSGEDKLTFRTEKYDGDISGDYSAYEITENVSIGGADVTLRINGDKCYSAVWQADSAYAIYSSAGLSREQTIKIIENIGQ